MDSLHIKVGILIPAYNIEKDIFRALESCLNQTYKNVEIIVVDDGSTDRTYDVVKRYSSMDERIKLFQQKNGGVSSARNCAIEHCTSDYVVFLDADDWLENNTIERYVQKLAEQKNEPVLLSSGRYYVEAGSFSRSNPDSGIDSITMSSDEALMYVGKRIYNLRNAGYKLYSMEVIHKHALRFDSNIRHGEDGLFVFEYLKAVKNFVYFSEPLWNVYRRPGSACRSPYNSTMLSALMAIEKMLAYDNSKPLCQKLNIYFVQRTLGILSSAFRTQPLHEKDIVFLRKKLRQKFGLYMILQKSLRQKLIYIFEVFGPRYLVIKILKKRKGQMISV